MNKDNFDFDSFMEEAKKMKMMMVETSQRGDMPPVVFVEKNGKVQGIIVAPQVDKHAGLHAARLARIGFDADALSIVMDAHASVAMPEFTEGMTEEEQEEAIRKKFPPGSMQRMCDEEGACERGEIVDVLLCHRVNRDGHFTMMTLPYAYHGKEGPPFKWLEDNPLMKKYQDAQQQSEPITYKGLIPETLKEIMAEPSILNRAELASHLTDAANILEIEPERQQYHIARAMLKVLNGQGFLVFDLQTPPEGYVPDPIMPIPKISAKDLLPDIAIQKIIACLEKCRRSGAVDDIKNLNFNLERIIMPYYPEIVKKAASFGLSADDIDVHLIVRLILEGKTNE